MSIDASGWTVGGRRVIPGARVRGHVVIREEVLIVRERTERAPVEVFVCVNKGVREGNIDMEIQRKLQQCFLSSARSKKPIRATACVS